MRDSESFVTLRGANGDTAVIAPRLGAWLLRYTAPAPGGAPLDLLHFDSAVVDRYPNQMYAGNPLLFPMVSFNHLPDRQHHYSWAGKVFSLPQHGFARRLPWTVTRQSETAVAMELRDSESTRPDYPFSFRHEVAYELRDGRLSFRQEIENTGSDEMPFSTGIHPYLKVPLSSKSARNDCYLDLPASYHISPGPDWLSWSSEPRPAQRLSLGVDSSGTLFLTALQRREISLVDPHAGLRIVLNFEEAPSHPFVALWARTTAEPYYCIEPWTALPNSFARRSADLSILPPGHTFRAAAWLKLAQL